MVFSGENDFKISPARDTAIIHFSLFNIHYSLRTCCKYFATRPFSVFSVKHLPVLQTQAGKAAPVAVRAGFRIGAPTVDADAVFTVPGLHGPLVLKMPGGGVAEDHRVITGIPLCPQKPIPNCKISLTRVA